MGVPLRNSPPRRSSGRNRSNRSSSSNKSTTLSAIRMSSSSSSSNSMGRKEIVQLTLIGMAICAGIILSKTSTMNKKYKRLNDFYYYASTGTTTISSNDDNITASTSNTATSITAIITNDTATATATTITAMIKHDKEYEIKLKELKLWRQIRNEKITIYNEWFLNKKGDDKLCPNADSLHTTESITFNVTSTEQGVSLLPPLPPKNGPILDFVVGK